MRTTSHSKAVPTTMPVSAEGTRCVRRGRKTLMRKEKGGIEKASSFFELKNYEKIFVGEKISFHFSGMKK